MPIEQDIPANIHPTPQPMRRSRTRRRVTAHSYTRISFRKETRPAPVCTSDIPTLGDQSDTREGTPSERVPVSEGNITSWLKTVSGDLACLTPSPLILSSPPQVTSHSELQRAAVQSLFPTHPSNHQSPPIMQPSPTHSTNQLPGLRIPIRLEVSPRSAGMTHGDGQAGKYATSPGKKRTVVRGPRLRARPFESDTADLCARLLAEGANPHCVGLLDRVFPNGVSDDALMAPTWAGPNPLSGKRWTEKGWHLLCEVKREGTGSIVYSCRLCPENGPRRCRDSRNILRHLRKDHFGLALVCEYWWVGSSSTRDYLTFLLATIIPSQTRRTRNITKHARGGPLY